MKSRPLLETTMAGCRQCRKPFDAAVWPRSKYTMTGFSPWCPTCDALYATHKQRRNKPGPKPKLRGVALASRWTNMPH
jgi:thiol-disulfide isomerase/thioredoxin